MIIRKIIILIIFLCIFTCNCFNALIAVALSDNSTNPYPNDCDFLPFDFAILTDLIFDSPNVFENRFCNDASVVLKLKFLT